MTDTSLNSIFRTPAPRLGGFQRPGGNTSKDANAATNTIPYDNVLIISLYKLFMKNEKTNSCKIIMTVLFIMITSLATALPGRITHTFFKTPGGHSGTVWRMFLKEFLTLLFK